MSNEHYEWAQTFLLTDFASVLQDHVVIIFHPYVTTVPRGSHAFLFIKQTSCRKELVCGLVE